MAVGQGLLVVPDGDTLRVFRSPATALPPSASVAEKRPLPVGPPHTGADTSAATTYYQSASHNAVATGSSINAHLRRTWSHVFGTPVSYSLVSGSSVYAGAGGSVYALDRATGTTLWGPVDLHSGVDVHLTLTGTTIFADSEDGHVAALNAATGAFLWQKYLGSGITFAGTPEVQDGLVFIPFDTAEFDIGVALREATGSIAYYDNVPAAAGDIAPTVGPAGQVYFNGTGGQVYAVAPATGKINWHVGCCTGGGTEGAVYAGGYLYGDGGSIFKPSNGALVSNFQGRRVVVDNGATFTLTGRNVVATSTSTNLRRYWSFAGDGTLATDPIVVNNLVVVEGTSGRVWALDESTGAIMWSGIAGPRNRNIGDNRAAPSSGAGTLLVPDVFRLTAFADG
jgi:outer membrane protein assembly factor BamB